MPRPSLITICFFIVGFILGLKIPKGWIVTEHIKIVTGFLAFYSAGIFPSITLMMNTIDGNNMTPKEVIESRRNIKSSIISLIFILAASLFCVFFVYLSFELKDVKFSIKIYGCSILNIQSFCRGCTVACFIIATYGSLWWLPKKILLVFDTKYSLALKKAQEPYDKALTSCENNMKKMD